MSKFEVLRETNLGFKVEPYDAVKIWRKVQSSMRLIEQSGEWKPQNRSYRGSGLAKAHSNRECQKECSRTMFTCPLVGQRTHNGAQFSKITLRWRRCLSYVSTGGSLHPARNSRTSSGFLSLSSARTMLAFIPRLVSFEFFNSRKPGCSTTGCRSMSC